MSALLDAVRELAETIRKGPSRIKAERLAVAHQIVVAHEKLAAAFGSPDRAEAIVEALELSKKRIRGRSAGDIHALEAIEALLRSLAEALGVATGGSDDEAD